MWRKKENFDFANIKLKDAVDLTKYLHLKRVINRTPFWKVPEQ